MKYHMWRKYLVWGIAVCVHTAITSAYGFPPSPPTGLAVTGEGASSISLAWNTHPNTCWPADQTDCVIGYCLYYNTSIFVSPSNYIGQACMAGISYTFYGLTQGQNYYFVATAFDTEGEESSPTWNVAAKPGPPATPTGLAVVEAKNGHVALSWNINTDVDILGYIIRWDIFPNSNFPNSSGVLYGAYNNSYTVYGLTNGQQYGFIVHAVDNFNNASIASSSITVHPLSYGGVPQWPVNSSEDSAYHRINGTFGEVHGTGGNHLHGAIDIDTYGLPQARAALDGKVGEKPPGGQSIVILHKDSGDPLGEGTTFSRKTKYLHISPRVDLTTNSFVIAGEALGTVLSSEGHLHFEMHYVAGGKTYKVNPLHNDVPGWSLWGIAGYPSDSHDPVIKNVFLQPRPDTNSELRFTTETGGISATDGHVKINLTSTDPSVYDPLRDNIFVRGEILPIVNALDQGINTTDFTSMGDGLTVHKALYSLDYNTRYAIGFDRIKIDPLPSESTQVYQIFHFEEPCVTQLNGNDDYIELRSLDDVFIYPHKQDFIINRGILNTTQYGDGYHTLTFVVEDASGRSATDELEIIIDNFTPPRFDFFSATPLPFSAINDNTPTISVNYSDPFGIDLNSVDMLITGPNNFLLQPGPSQMTVTQTGVSFTPSQPLGGGEGGYNVQVLARDGTGNLGNFSWVFTIDTTPPVIQSVSLASPLNGNTAFTTNPVDVTVSFTDNVSGVSDILLSNDNVNFMSFLAGSSPQTLTWGLPSPDGQKTVYVKVKDRAGNTSTIVSSIITLDTSVPATSTQTVESIGFSPLGVGETDPSPGSTVTFTSQDSFIFSWDPAVFYDENGVAVYLLVVKDLTTGNIHQQGTTSSPSFLATGLVDKKQYYAIIRPQDPAGNIGPGVGTGRVIVDQTFPQITGVDDGIFTNNPSHIAAIWQASDLESGILDIQFAIGILPGTTNVFDFTSVGIQTSTTVVFATPLTEGNYYWIIKATNQTGLSTQEVSDGIIVDITPPISPISSNANGSNPSPWKNVQEYNISWTNPSDVSGIAGARVKFDGTPPVSNDEGDFFVVSNSKTGETNTIVYSTISIQNGSNLLWLWLEDKAGNSNPNNNVQAILRFDNQMPSSIATSASTASAGPIPIDFTAEDQQFLSGISETFLWFRHDNNDNQIFRDWQKIQDGISGNGAIQSTGTFAFYLQIDGNYHFYTQSFDIAGNYEPVPVSTTIPKSITFYDGTLPVITNIIINPISHDSVLISWQTDDETTAVIRYGRSTAISQTLQETNLSRLHKVILNNLTSPTQYFYKITATNRTGLTGESPLSFFITSTEVFVPSDDFGIIDLSKSIQVDITNPELHFTNIKLADGMVINASVVMPDGTRILQATLDGVNFVFRFPTEYFMPIPDMPFVISEGGGLLKSDISMTEITVSQVDQCPMTSPSSKLYLGYYSRIDSVAPGNITDFQSLTGPGYGEITLTWTAVGDDENVGTAMKYDIRIATEQIAEFNFEKFAKIPAVPIPKKAGETETFVLSGLENSTTYYFAIKSIDELLNKSSAPGIASARTLNPTESPGTPGTEPIVSVPPDILKQEIPPTLIVHVSTNVITKGGQKLTLTLNGFSYATDFIVDRATRTVRLARLVIDNGGLMSLFEQGKSAVDMTTGQSKTFL